MFFFKKLISIVLLVTLVGGGYWFVRIRPAKLSADYQAVFLSNGQVYFGKLQGLGTDYPILTDVYYLVVQRPLQQAAAAEATEEGDVVAEGEEAPESTRPQFTLVKLGGELHGPQGEMRISRQHILFVEDLKDDSKVVQKIRESESAEGANEVETEAESAE